MNVRSLKPVLNKRTRVEEGEKGNACHLHTTNLTEPVIKKLALLALTVTKIFVLPELENGSPVYFTFIREKSRSQYLYEFFFLRAPNEIFLLADS